MPIFERTTGKINPLQEALDQPSRMAESCESFQRSDVAGGSSFDHTSVFCNTHHDKPDQNNRASTDIGVVVLFC